MKLAIFCLLSAIALALGADSKTSTEETTPTALRGSSDTSHRKLTAPLVTFYEHYHYQGRSLQVTRPGYFGADFLTKNHFNNLISSMKVAPGYAVLLCYDSGCTNRKSVPDAGAHPAFGHSNDRVSTFIVFKPAAILYEDYHYRGKGLVALESGNFDIDYFHRSNSFNDKASSMIIAPGYKVLLCYHAGFSACKHEADVGNHPVFGHSNDKVSSIKVTFSH